MARGFAAAGARWIHVVDLDGARDGGRRQTEAVARIVAAVGRGVSCEVAGGLRDEAAVEAALAAGAARAVVGTAALRDPAFVERLVARFGAERIAVALDVRDGLAVGHGWVPGSPGVPADEALAGLADRGAADVHRHGDRARRTARRARTWSLLGRMVALDRGDVVASGGRFVARRPRRGPHPRLRRRHRRPGNLRGRPRSGRSGASGTGQLTSARRPAASQQVGGCVLP